MPEYDFVDIAGRNAGIGQRLIGDLDDKTFNGLGVEFTERRVRPSNDAGGHGQSPGGGTKGSGDEITAQLVFDMDADDIVKILLGGGKAELACPFGIEVPRPAVDDAGDE